MKKETSSTSDKKGKSKEDTVDSDEEDSDMYVDSENHDDAFEKL